MSLLVPGTVSRYLSGSRDLRVRTAHGHGSWPGVPGQTAVLRTPTPIKYADIRSVEIPGPTGKALSRLTI